MSPREFNEAQSAIYIYQDHGMVVENTMSCWIVKYPDGSIHGQFYDSCSMYHAAVGFKQGYMRGTAKADGKDVTVTSLAERIGDTFIDCSVDSPHKQWKCIKHALRMFNYDIREMK